MRARVLLPVGAIVFAMLLPSAASASSCTPPYCPGPTPKPDNHFTLRKVRHPKTGVVTIRVRVHGPGVITASGKWMIGAEARVMAAGTYTMTLQLTEEGMQELESAPGRQLRVRVTFAFTPTGGTTRKKIKKLIFRVIEHPKPTPAGAPEELAPNQVVVASTATIKRGEALIRVFCNGPGPCHGTLRLVASGNVTLGSASFDLEAGVSPVLQLPLTPRGEKLLNGGGVRSAMATGTGLHPHEVKLKFATG